MSSDLAITVLGCKHTGPRGGARPAAFLRRVASAARLYRALAAEGRVWVVASGGRAWRGVVEADAMAEELVLRGVPRERIVRERCSHSTSENARFAASALARRGVTRVHLVTCDWHMERAARHFQAEGLDVIQSAAKSPAPLGPRARLRGSVRSTREWIAARFVLLTLETTMLVLLALLAGASCKPSGGAPTSDAGVAPAPTREDVLRSIARAEDLRRTADVDPAWRVSHDVVVRRRAARALARIGDEAAIAPLLRALSDEDPETAAWGAYGLGFACKGHEPAHVAALAARGTSLADDAVVTAGPAGDASSASASSIDLRVAIARALGHCAAAAPAAEVTLAGWLKSRPAWGEAASLALGDAAARRGDLGDDALTALLDAAQGGAGRAKIPSALYAFGRVKSVREPFAARAAEVARAALEAPGSERIFAVRALGRVGAPGVKDLARVVLGKGTFSAAERGEAARALGTSDTGRASAGATLVTLLADKTELEPAALLGDELDVLLVLVASLPPDPGSAAEHALYTLSSLAPPEGDAAKKAAVERRWAKLRCTAAGALAKGSYDAEVLAKCAPAGLEIAESARLAAVLKRPLVAERRRAWAELARSPHLRVREAAIDGLAAHPEAGDAGRAAIVAALSAKEAGLVATAADLVTAHPDRALAVSEHEKRAALDPAAPPPTSSPDKEIDKTIALALAHALTNEWAEDLVETRVALLDAAAALGLPETKAAAKKACGNANVTVRARAKKVLASLGDTSTCASPAAPSEAAPELGAPLALPTRVTLTTDVGARLVLLFDLDLAPVTAARLTALARAGFYKGIVVHRVVPGFVVQLGDPGGDGYGGSGHALRCETSPVPFAPHDIGMALAGRDTGSSQIFVTLARAPHLDGEYAKVGSAEGDFDSVAEGDVVADVTVTP